MLKRLASITLDSPMAAPNAQRVHLACMARVECFHGKTMYLPVWHSMCLLRDHPIPHF